MSDEMAIIVIVFVVGLFFLYRRSNSGGYASDFPLPPGTHRIGEDLDPGKGDLIATSGGGDISILERGTGNWSHNFKLHANSGAVPNRYRNLTLHPHDILEINGNIQVLMTPSTPIKDVAGVEFTQGTYQFGVDVPPAKYDLKAVGGDGQVQLFLPDADSYSFYQDMNPSVESKAAVYDNLLCEPGSRLIIEGTLKLTLTPSKKQRGWVYKVVDFLNQDP